MDKEGKKGRQYCGADEQVGVAGVLYDGCVSGQGCRLWVCGQYRQNWKNGQGQLYGVCAVHQRYSYFAMERFLTALHY